MPDIIRTGKSCECDQDVNVLIKIDLQVSMIVTSKNYMRIMYHICFEDGSTLMNK